MKGKMNLCKDYLDPVQMTLEEIQNEITTIHKMDEEFGGEDGQKL